MAATALSLPQFSAAGDPSGSMPAPAVLSGHPNEHAIYLAVIAQLSNARAGTASTKTKGEVSGGGKKPYKQKHTGRARQGSTRNPQWSGGGVSFGPRPRKYHREVPAATRRLALRSVLAGKIREGRVVLLDALALEANKTRHVAALLKKLKFEGNVLVVLHVADAGVKRAFRNMPAARVDAAWAVSAYDLLKARHVVIVKDALEALVKRCGDPE